MSSHQKKMPNAATVLPMVASIAASAMLIQTIANNTIPGIPYEIRNFLSSNFHNLLRHFSSQFTIVVEEHKGLSPNQVFQAAEGYLGTIVTPSVHRVSVSKVQEEKKLAITMDKGEEIADVFENVQVRWKLICRDVDVSSTRQLRQDNRFSNAPLQTKTRSYELTFHKKHKEMVLNSYLPYILVRSKAIKDESKVIKIHSVDNINWNSNEIDLDHPMTFNTLAIDMELKKALLDDLNNFMKAKEYYRRIGKAWKRGYLLYGPPGTGKSSLIAAMANYLNYDIYDLDLTGVQSNSELRSMMLGMSNRSILVVEDIDCSIKLQNRQLEDEPVNNGENQVTLSGLLNAVDGLWSSIGNERIIVFTTNHKEKLDPALLRPGRMDMHIHISYCSSSAFKQLAFNYLGISHHKLFEEIEELIEEVKVTPAQVAGELMQSNDAEVSLRGLGKFLQKKKLGQDDPETNNESEFPKWKEVKRGRPLRRRGRGRGRGFCRRF